MRHTSYFHGVSSGLPRIYCAHIWCWGDIFGPKKCAYYRTRLMKAYFQKISMIYKISNTHFNKIKYFIIWSCLCWYYFPYPIIYIELFSFLLKIIFTWQDIKVRRGHCKIFFRIGKPLTDLPKKWYLILSYLIYLSFTTPNVHFSRRQINYIGGYTVQPLNTNVTALFLM